MQANHTALSRIARLQRAHQIMHDDIMATAARSEKVLDGLERDLLAFRADSDARLTDADRRAIADAQRAEAERARVAGAKFEPPPTCPSCGKPNGRPFHTCRRGAHKPQSLGAAGPECPKCGRPMTLLVKDWQRGDVYGCGPCGTLGVS